jgi:hypothetical protein
MILHTRLLFFAAGLTVSQRLILLHPDHAGDAALLAHERTHQAQMKRVGGALGFWYAYLRYKSFRQKAEVEAYQVQISHGAKRSSCARYLAENYWLHIDYATAYALLKDYHGNSEI